MAPHQDTQTRSRLAIGEDGPSASALAAARDGRLRRPAAERHAARCASRVLCSGGAPWRYSPSQVSDESLGRSAREMLSWGEKAGPERYWCGARQTAKRPGLTKE